MAWNEIYPLGMIGVIIIFDILMTGLSLFSGSMVWYENITEQQKKQFWTVIVVSVIGSILILSIPVICHLIF